MTEPIITKDILRRYLIATGAAKPDGLVWMDNPIHELLNLIDECGMWCPRLDPIEYHAALALCAAYETMVNLDCSLAHRTPVQKLLRLAGIDPKRWDETQ